MTGIELVAVALALWVFVLGALVVGWLVIESVGRYAEALVNGRECGACGMSVSATERATCDDCGVRR